MSTTQYYDNPAKSNTIATRFLKDAFSHGTQDSVSFVTTLFRESVNLKASDVLLEPRKNSVVVRARIDGELYRLGEIPEEMYDSIASRIKVLAKLDSSEKRKVQEGQFSLEHEKRTINFRVETVLTIHGELIVARIHEKGSIIMELSQLGFNDQSSTVFQDILKSRSGLLIVCGPTGCGKTTTIYSTLNHINKDKNLNVMTIEDPVEFQMEGINQIQTQDELGFTFAQGLKTVLRLSPDVIFVGEIRDKETAKIAIESGLTGQLVLSTVHADDTAGALFRILDLGIESYLLNSALSGIVAQRLVRKICPDCKTQYQPTSDENDIFKKELNKTPQVLFKGKGCLSCQNISFKGRIGIFEILKMDSTIRDQIRNKVGEHDLRLNLQQKGFTTILADGIQKAEQGITTIEEVLKNCLRSA